MVLERTNPPRPPNSWMCFRSAFIKSRRDESPKEDEDPPLVKESARELSILASAVWRKASEEFKRKWAVVAEKKKMQHMQDFPNYKYHPQKKEDKERKKLLKTEDKKRAKNNNSNKIKKPRALRGVERRQDNASSNDSIASVRDVEQSILGMHSTAAPSYFLQWHTSIVDGCGSSSPATPPSSAGGDSPSPSSSFFLQCYNREDYYPSSPLASSRSCGSASPPDSLYSAWTPSSTTSSLPDEQASGAVEASAASPALNSYSLPWWAAAPASNEVINSSATHIASVNSSQSYRDPPGATSTTPLTWEEAQVLANFIPLESPYDPDAILNVKSSSLLQDALEIQQFGGPMSTTALEHDDEVEVRVGNKRVKAEALLKNHRTSPSPFLYPCPESSPVQRPPYVSHSLPITHDEYSDPGSLNSSYSDYLSAQLPTDVDVTIGKQEAHLNEELDGHIEMESWAYSNNACESQDLLLATPEDDFALPVGQELVPFEDSPMYDSFDSPYFRCQREGSKTSEEDLDWLDQSIIRE